MNLTTILSGSICGLIGGASAGFGLWLGTRPKRPEDDIAREIWITNPSRTAWLRIDALGLNIPPRVRLPFSADHLGLSWVDEPGQNDIHPLAQIEQDTPKA